MNDNILKKAWKDPVISKIISVWIIALLTIIYNISSSLITKRSFRQEFISFWTFKIELWYVITFLLILSSIFYLFYRKFRYDDDTLTLDKDLFNRIRNRPLIAEFFLEVKGNGFSSRPVEMDKVSAMIDFREDSKKAEFEFFNPRLEKLRVRLIADIEEFDNALSKYIFGANVVGWVSIPSEWEYDNPNKLKEAKSAIEPLENKLSKTYQDFISQGRKILKV